MEMPSVLDATKVGTYPARCKAGGGYVWDEVLEYRVWYFGDEGDTFRAFVHGEDAVRAASEPGAGEALALVLQREYLDEPSPGVFRHVREPRVTEWPLEFLSRPRRDEHTILDFLAPDAPANRLNILRGIDPRP